MKKTICVCDKCRNSYSEHDTVSDSYRGFDPQLKFLNNVFIRICGNYESKLDDVDFECHVDLCPVCAGYLLNDLFLNKESSDPIKNLLV